jgi:hypothetical protein
MNYIHLSDPNEASGWDECFTLLAVKASEPLLSVMGVPEAMATAPECLREVSWAFINPNSSEEEGGSEEEDGFEADLRAAEKRLNPLLQRLEECYGSEVLEEFYRWAWRHFVNYDCLSTYRFWDGVMPLMAGFGRWSNAAVNASVDSYIRERIVEAAREVRGDERMEELAQQIAQVQKIPVSAKEEDFVNPEPRDEERLSTPQILEDRWREVVLLERVYHVWVNLKQTLAPEQMEALLNWAHVIGRMAHFDEDRVKLPSC